ncbi:phenylalanine--tRNA ligase subunit beta [Silvimonas sp.]|uniref:phenylalanine--tRNA ligase subunit beta n=1 Tax=Silvimonas sp. TaxID=2650811 RepID=UPI00284C7671|nr:phenylalanine--tRNA ligase subunit beta [Silvimonas sp.]MDR3428077.1 phenylalanine--tRNA ligase subunit beta [Silvimonas sp.]
MKFSEQWLRSWANPQLESEALAHLLTMAGLEVEEADPAAPAFTDVIVAEVLTVTRHENADRLNVCTVNVGEAEPIQIVCGAPNVAPGIRVPCARVGAVLPGDFKIKQAKVRGVESNGMLCSAKELGVSEESSGLLVLPADAPVGVALREYLNLDDTLLTLKLTPNRADCLSIRGIAREVAALTGVAQTPVEITPVAPAIDDAISIKLEAGSACPRYAGRIVRNINRQAATPDWMKQRLERSGIRSISAVVDITNYVMLELGQPMHAFDANKLQGGILVRFAREGEKLTLLNGKELDLATDMLVITDGTRPVALAGIMGGANSEIDDASTDIFLESAFFAPADIAGKARRLGFSSDASHRFERGVDFGNVRPALERATQLLVDVCGGQVGPIVEQVAELPARKQVALRVSRVAKVLGLTLPGDEVLSLLRRLGLSAELAGDVITVTPPSFRFDLEIEEDLIEEVARVYGYDNIPTRPAASRIAMLPQPGNARDKFSLKRILVAAGYQESINYSFVEEKWERELAGNTAPVKLINPIASQMSVMRSSLLGGLVNALQYNLNRKAERVRLFEVGRVFHGVTAQVQPEKIGGLAWGTRDPEQWAAAKATVDFFDIKADVEALIAPRVAEFRRASHPALHPGRSAEIVLDGIVVGWLGELHPQWTQAYELGQSPVVFELDAAALLSVNPVRAKAVSRVQAVRRDLALVVDESQSLAALQSAFAAAKQPLVTAIELFDIYRGKGVPEGKKSLAFKVLMQDTLKTLTDEEVDATVTALIAAAQACGATLRA